MLKLILITLGLLALSYLDSVVLSKKFHHAKSVINPSSPYVCRAMDMGGLKPSTVYVVSVTVDSCFKITEQTK